MHQIWFRLGPHGIAYSSPSPLALDLRGLLLREMEGSSTPLEKNRSRVSVSDAFNVPGNVSRNCSCCLLPWPNSRVTVNKLLALFSILRAQAGLCPPLSSTPAWKVSSSVSRRMLPSAFSTTATVAMATSLTSIKSTSARVPIKVSKHHANLAYK